MQLELLHVTDTVLRSQIENKIAKHKMKKEVIAGGHGKGSRRFTVQHNPEESYDYRRNQGKLQYWLCTMVVCVFGVLI